MAKSKPYVYFGVTVPLKLARKIEFHLRAARRLQPHQRITKSGFVAHILAEWVALLENPNVVPTTTVPPRRWVRPPAIRTEGRLTPREVKQIRRDRRPSADVARDLGVNRSTVGRVRNGETHRSVL